MTCWTDDDGDLVRGWLRLGWSSRQIATKLGTTRSAVIAFCRRRGIPFPNEKRPGVLRHDKRHRPTLPQPFFLPDERQGPLTLLELESHHCRWPVSGVGLTTLFCAEPSADITDRRPYCQEHMQLSRGKYDKSA